MQKSANVDKLNCIRYELGLHGLVQIHHVIPKSLKDHETLVKYNYDIESFENLVFMPSSEGHAFLGLSKNRLIHDGPHKMYTQYVKSTLDLISSSCDLERLINSLRVILHSEDGHSSIPWA